MERARARRFESSRDPLPVSHVEAAGCVLVSDHAEEDRILIPDPRPHFPQNIRRELETAFLAAAVGVLAVVRHRRHELGEKVKVRGVNLHRVGTYFPSPLRGHAKSLDNRLEFPDRVVIRALRARHILAVDELGDGFDPLFLDRFRQFRKTGLELPVSDADAADIPVCLDHVGRFDDDQAHSARGTFGVIVDEPLGDSPVCPARSVAIGAMAIRLRISSGPMRNGVNNASMYLPPA